MVLRNTVEIKTHNGSHTKKEIYGTKFPLNGDKTERQKQREGERQKAGCEGKDFLKSMFAAFGGQ